eukprot:CAMPEP_0171456600 /NCGR_PEP_ID=MMETSP0945-20130129/3019_1 /TAXON_ID=109269 /ORGANISM="Vaucheria litorea, Strain CCMP2940" /LENGTH=574 /DNA_ID=CAMNT_0011982051 /DNA_START=368 /DNA_END=2092 /DNA_ORIENTATION=-
MAQSFPGIPLTKETLLAESSKTLPLPSFSDIPAPPMGLVSLGTNSQSPKQNNQEDPYYISSEDQERFESLFPSYDPDRDGFITGNEAVPLFNKSGLSRSVLKEIWDIADADRDSRLSLTEFISAMHLIVCVSKRNLPVPTSLPQSLKEKLVSAPMHRKHFPPPPYVAPKVPNKQISIVKTESANDMFGGMEGEGRKLSPYLPPSNPPAARQRPPPSQNLMKMEEKPMASPQNNQPSLIIQAEGMGIPPLVPHQYNASPARPEMAANPIPLNDIGRENAGFFLGGDAGAGGGGMNYEADMHSLEENSEGIIDVSRKVLISQSNWLDSQKVTTDRVKRIVERLREEKTNLLMELQRIDDEKMKGQSCLDELTNQAENLQAELNELRTKYSESLSSEAEVREKCKNAEKCRDILSNELTLERSNFQVYSGTEKSRNADTPRPTNYQSNGSGTGSVNFNSQHALQNQGQMFPEENSVPNVVMPPPPPTPPVPPMKNPTPPMKNPTPPPLPMSEQIDPFENFYQNKNAPNPSHFEPFQGTGDSDPFADPFAGVSEMGNTFDAFPTPTSEAPNFEPNWGR